MTADRSTEPVYVAADGSQYSASALAHGVRAGALNIESVEDGLTVNGTFYRKLEATDDPETCDLDTAEEE